MKTLKNGLKPITFLLTALVLFQSCVVYHKAPTTLERASQERIKTKITNSNGETSKYDYISYEDGTYYGVNKDFEERGALIKTPLNQSEIEKILTKNKSASTWITAGLIAVPVLAISVIVSLNSISIQMDNF